MITIMKNERDYFQNLKEMILTHVSIKKAAFIKKDKFCIKYLSKPSSFINWVTSYLIDIDTYRRWEVRLIRLSFLISFNIPTALLCMKILPKLNIIPWLIFRNTMIHYLNKNIPYTKNIQKMNKNPLIPSNIYYFYKELSFPLTEPSNTLKFYLKLYNLEKYYEKHQTRNNCQI